MSIHATAIIDPKAEIASGVSIGPYTVIESDVIVGEGTEIGPHVLLASGARIGSNCRIFKGASIGTEPQDLKFGGEKTLLKIGDNTTVREFCTLNRGTKAHGESSIGSGCLLMAYCHVAHDCIIGNNVVIANSLAMAGHVTIGNNVNLAGVVSIHQFCRVGDYAFVGATCYVNMDIVPYALVGATPLRITGLNKVGLERRGFDEARRDRIKKAYRILFRDGNKLDDAIGLLETTFAGDSDVDLLVDFVKKSERGIARMA
jgi:UDP-N-acetylglucosamine acyltransferase